MYCHLSVWNEKMLSLNTECVTNPNAGCTYIRFSLTLLPDISTYKYI